MGLTLFNDYVDHHYFAANPGTVHLLNSNTYRPNGGTALLDAVGETINAIEYQIRESHGRIEMSGSRYPCKSIIGR